MTIKNYTELSDTESAWLDHLAFARNDAKDKVGIAPTLWKAGHTGRIVHSLGIRGECIITKNYGGSVETWVAAYGDGKHRDIKIGTMDVEAKTRDNRSDGDLIFNHRDEFSAHIAILCNINSESPNRVELLGWTYQDHANTVGMVKNYGYGSRFVIDNSDLLPIDTLYEALQECNDWTSEEYEEYITASRQKLEKLVVDYTESLESESLPEEPPF